MLADVASPKEEPKPKTMSNKPSDPDLTVVIMTEDLYRTFRILLTPNGSPHQRGARVDHGVNGVRYVAGEAKGEKQFLEAGAVCDNERKCSIR